MTVMTARVQLAGFGTGSLVALVLFVVGCGPGSLVPAGDDASTSSTSSSTGETQTDESSSGDAGTSSGDSSESETGVPVDPVCGDGVVEAGEVCDDGPDNAWAGAACQPDCTLNTCGDGYMGLDELCDPGTGAPDSCSICLACGNKVYECGDTIDNDQDGLVDLADPDCLMPCDDTEYKFAPGLPAGAAECKMDCAWDPNTGGGDGHCEFNVMCDVLSPGAAFDCGYDENYNQCQLEQPDECLAHCVPGAPNGCDCFGCCEIAGVFRYVGRSSSCSADDPSQCAQCTPNPSCINPCEPEACELCFLQSPEQLAPGCAQPSCPGDLQPCTAPDGCPPGAFCQTGCCVEQVTP